MNRVGVVGASVRAMAASVRQAGWQAVAADLFADLDLRRLAPVTQLDRYPWSALRWLAEADVDAWCYTGGLENYPRLIQRMARLKPLWGNGPECVRRVRNPFWLAERLAQHGLAFPAVCQTLDDRPSNCREGWLRKPWRSAGGLQIGPVSLDRREPPDPRTFYFQKQIGGEPRSVALLSSRRGVEVVGVCRLASGPDFGAPGPFVIAGAATLAWEEVAERDELGTVAQVLHQEAAMRGLWGFDYVLAERPYLVEVNPRWTATMTLHERAAASSARYGGSHSLMRRHIGACQGAEAPPFTPAGGRHTMRILYATRSVEVSRAMLELVAGPAYFEGDDFYRAPSVADLPVPGSRIEAGQPLCTVYADGETEEEMARRLEARAAEVGRAFDPS